MSFLIVMTVICSRWADTAETVTVTLYRLVHSLQIGLCTFSVPPSWANMWAFVSPENPQVTRFFTTVSSFYHSCVSMKLSAHVIDLTETPLITNPGKKMVLFRSCRRRQTVSQRGEFSNSSPVSCVGWMRLDQRAQQMGSPQVHLRGYGADESVLLIHI